ncbi:hypothetical protein AGR1B_pa0028 [Agrobacterium fabacearum S56]|nr:hypothetical protein AGR1B_pa0028 [Agrobacterium fabacearum S56]
MTVSSFGSHLPGNLGGSVPLQISLKARPKECADLHVGKAVTLEDDPAVPKERIQGRNYTSLMRRACPRPLAGPS